MRERSGTASSSFLLTAVHRGHKTRHTGKLPVGWCPALPAWAELGIAEQRHLPAPHFSETFSVHVLVPLSFPRLFNRHF